MSNTEIFVNISKAITEVVKERKTKDSLDEGIEGTIAIIRMCMDHVEKDGKVDLKELEAAVLGFKNDTEKAA